MRARSGNDSEAQTVLANGKRVVYLDNYKENMSREAKLAMGIELQHEAYRDGIVGGNNGTETLFAVAGHTAMALRMANDPRYGQTMASLIGGNVNLQNDIAAMNALMKGEGGIFADYVDETYDSRGDFFRIIKDKDGNVEKVLDDGDLENATIVEADGTERVVPLDKSSMTKQLSDIIGGGMTPEKMNKIMMASGLDYDSEKKVWFAKTDDAKYEKPAEASVADDSAVSAPEPKQSFWQSAAAAAGAAWDAVKSSAGAVGDFLGGLFKKQIPVPEVLATEDNHSRQENQETKIFANTPVTSRLSRLKNRI